MTKGTLSLIVSILDALHELVPVEPNISYSQYVFNCCRMGLITEDERDALIIFGLD